MLLFLCLLVGDEGQCGFRQAKALRVVVVVHRVCVCVCELPQDADTLASELCPEHRSKQS